jgi:tricarballylate dehydrogenase
MKFEPERHAAIKGRHYFQPGIVIHTVGGGLGQVMRWRDIALENWNVDLRYDSRVVGFHGDHRHIDGVRVASTTDDYYLYGKSVIVCAGGFQANAEMRARYLGPNADLMKVRGSVHDTGEVLMSLLGLGAKAAGHWQGYHATPIDADARRWPWQLGQPLR